MDLPLITEATSDYYRSIYADPDLGPIFKGINMVVLRTHVSYFIHQLTMFDTPMTQRQLDYLRKVHVPVIQQHRVTQRHYDIMVSYLLEAMRSNGAQEQHLKLVLVKLEPLRDLFPADNRSSADTTVVDGTVVLQDDQQSSTAAGSRYADSLTKEPPASCPIGRGQQPSPVSNFDSKHAQKQRKQLHRQPAEQHKPVSWIRRLTSCMCSS